MPDFRDVHHLTEHYGFPFRFRPDQVYRVEACYPYQRAGLFDDAGTGKTAVGTALALAWESELNIVLAPPILGKQWTRWLESLKGAGKVVLYRGAPAKRAKLDISDARWLVMTIQLFKRDWTKLYNLVGTRNSTLLVDEASCISNVESDNYTAVELWANANKGNNRVVPITATPANHPLQAYAFIRLKTPKLYTSAKHFRDLHVAEYDADKKPTLWHNLDLVQQRLMLQSVRTCKEDVLDISKPNIIPIVYELNPDHRKLYDKLMNELLLELDVEGKQGAVLDATSQSKLYNVSQQIVTCPQEFDQKVKEAAAYELLEEVLEELDINNPAGSKLIIFTYYKVTSRSVVAWLKARGIDCVAAYSDISRDKQDAGLDRFMNDPACRVLVAQPTSAGYGLNPQSVCWEEVFFEFPINPMHFRQALERIWRDGQKHVPTIRVLIAEGTIQQTLLGRLMGNDDMASFLTGNPVLLRKLLTGEEMPVPQALNVDNFANLLGKY